MTTKIYKLILDFTRSARSGSINNKENKVKYNVDGYLLPMSPKGFILFIV